MDTVFDRVLCATDLSWGCSEVLKDLAGARESGLVKKAPLWPMGKVIVPVDITDFPGEAAEFLRPLARVVVREVVLAHVVEAGTSREVQRDFEVAAEGALADYAGEFEKAGLKTTVHVHRGEAPSGIIEIAVEEKAGMIIMPSRGRRVRIGLEKTVGGAGKQAAELGGEVIGSVAEEMLKHSPAPVMFLPQPYQSALRAA